jgi:ribosome-binding protein aMBF1 (putative translation factor)
MKKKKTEKTEKTEKTVEKAPEKKTRKYLDGNLREMTPAWKQLVQAKIDERRWSNARLADALGCNRTLVAKMLAEKQHSSRLVDRVCLILQIEEPLTASRAKDKLDEFCSGLDDDQRIKALDILRESFGGKVG